jgi:hypothetical protein
MIEILDKQWHALAESEVAGLLETVTDLGLNGSEIVLRQ